jgi:hypothetical protein
MEIQKTLHAKIYKKKCLEHAKQLSIQLRAVYWILHTKIIHKYIQYKTIIKIAYWSGPKKMCKGKCTLLRYCIINQGYLITFNYKAKKTCNFTIIETYGKVYIFTIFRNFHNSGLE